MKDASEARRSGIASGHPNGSITALFERAGKARSPSRTGNTQRRRQSLFIHHHNIEKDSSLTCCLRAEIVHWVSESTRPFKIVKDRGFQSLMKTGWPGYYIPSPSTVSRDVRMVFAHTRQRIANMLQVSGCFLGPRFE
jgi:hypothetical protein